MLIIWNYLLIIYLDPFADAIKGADDNVQDGLVHIRIQQRNGRKTLTTVQGLSSEYDLKKIVRACKKVCSETVKIKWISFEIFLLGIRLQRNCYWTSGVRWSFATPRWPKGEYLSVANKVWTSQIWSVEGARFLIEIMFFFLRKRNIRNVTKQYNSKCH